MSQLAFDDTGHPPARQTGQAPPNWKRSGTAALAGPGWSIPDQGLHPYPLPEWDRRIRAAVDALHDGLGDAVAARIFNDANRANEATGAIELNIYVTRLRRRPERSPWPPPGLVKLTPPPQK